MRKIYFNLFCFSVWQWQVTGWAKWFKDLKTIIQLVTPSITSLSLELFIPLTLTQLIALFGVAWAVRRYKHGRRRLRARKPPWSWQPTHDHREKCSLSCDWSVSGDPGPWLVRWDSVRVWGGHLSPEPGHPPVTRDNGAEGGLSLVSLSPGSPLIGWGPWPGIPWVVSSKS